MGTPDFAVPCLEALVASEHYEVVMVITQPDRPKGRGLQKMASPVKEAALKLGLNPILQPERIRNSAELTQMLQCPADFLITVAYGQLLPQICLDHPRIAPINVHASLLPAYRGSAPLHRVLLNGETETGITTMKMVRTLDAGDILLQKSISIGPNETVGELHDRLCLLGSDLLLKTLEAYRAGTMIPVAQDETKVSFAPPIVDLDQKVQWQKSAAVIKNQIRGLNPWPVAYTVYRNQIWKLWQVQVLSTTGCTATPGEILKITVDGILIQCGQGELLLTEIQPSGKKRMNTADYLRGNPVQVGEFLC